ncbi:MAG: LUD domain-containing protein [Bacteroidales bacterium]|nr:LUD domain-containing protein [Bacteroidales bacterium]
MKESTSKEKILKNIRNALINKTENPYQNIDFDSSVYNLSTEPDEIVFAQEFIKVGGKFIFCQDYSELAVNLNSIISENNWKNVFCKDSKIIEFLNKANILVSKDESEFNSIDAGITGCEYLVARLGSIIVSSRQMPGRKMAGFPPAHIVIASTKQVVRDLKDALEKLKKKYSSNFPSFVSIITGPSRTADIEKTLILGAHGPKTIFCFLVDV